MTPKQHFGRQYQIIQERYEPGCDDPTQDDFPYLFGSIEEAREYAKDGFRHMFEHDGDSYFIAELEPYLDGVTYTGRQFPL